MNKKVLKFEGKDNPITLKKIKLKDTINNTQSELNVSGAFHSPLMEEANLSLNKVINSVNFNDSNIAIYQNVSPVENFEGEKIKQNLKLSILIFLFYIY